MRQASFERNTKETRVKVFLNLDGQREIRVSTGLGYLDHMLELLAFWASWDLKVEAQGDLEVDAHHTIEDIGLSLGSCLDKAWQDRKGILRVGQAKVPMDEALVESIVDISGRPFLVCKGFSQVPALVFGEEKDVFREFFKSLSFSARFNLHLIFHYGSNGHHLLEAAFKSLGLAMREALTLVSNQISSTKGSLD
ncbi:MAG: imidazoleglycerol-phosphate dehydratase [Desulfonauticus sp.]|jgi:imidazoleglycerol-phosphate dehydratase|nr:MAG: Imidazoleglycerol-phosphate dehydratase [Desulfonauticus sp. 38_4375]MDK2920777.1 imidazoleglycerol-phosphate dehydratase [Desulfonauticus sp.]